MMLTPNIWLTPLFGKLLFCVFDILAGLMIYNIIRMQSYDDRTATKGALVWLFNPLTVTVSSRGNAESIMAVLVLFTFQCLLKRQTKMCACVLALSVSFQDLPTDLLPAHLFSRWRQRGLHHLFL